RRRKPSPGARCGSWPVPFRSSSEKEEYLTTEAQRHRGKKTENEERQKKQVGQAVPDTAVERVRHSLTYFCAFFSLSSASVSLCLCGSNSYFVASSCA